MLVVPAARLEDLIDAFSAAYRELWTTTGFTVKWKETDEEIDKKARALMIGALSAMTDGDQIIEQGVHCIENFGNGQTQVQFPTADTRKFRST